MIRILISSLAYSQAVEVCGLEHGFEIDRTLFFEEERNGFFRIGSACSS